MTAFNSILATLVALTLSLPAFAAEAGSEELPNVVRLGDDEYRVKGWVEVESVELSFSPAPTREAAACPAQVNVPTPPVVEETCPDCLGDVVVEVVPPPEVPVVTHSASVSPATDWRILNRLAVEVGAAGYTSWLAGPMDPPPEFGMGVAGAVRFRAGEAFTLVVDNLLSWETLKERSRFNWQQAVAAEWGFGEFSGGLGFRNSLTFMADGTRDNSLLGEIRGGWNFWGGFVLQARLGLGRAWYWTHVSEPTSCSSVSDASDCVNEGWVENSGTALNAAVGLVWRF